MSRRSFAILICALALGTIVWASTTEAEREKHHHGHNYGHHHGHRGTRKVHMLEVASHLAHRKSSRSEGEAIHTRNQKIPMKRRSPHALTVQNGEVRVEGSNKGPIPENSVKRRGFVRKRWPPRWIKKHFPMPGGIKKLHIFSPAPWLQEGGERGHLYPLPMHHAPWIRPAPLPGDSHPELEPLPTDPEPELLEPLPLPEDQKPDPLEPLPLPPEGTDKFKKIITPLPFPKKQPKEKLPPRSKTYKAKITVPPPPKPKKKLKTVLAKIKKKAKKVKKAKKKVKLVTIIIQKFKSGWVNDFKLRDIIFGNQAVLRRIFAKLKKQETILKVQTSQKKIANAKRTVGSSAAEAASAKMDKYNDALDAAMSKYQDSSMKAQELLTKCRNVIYIAKTKLPLTSDLLFNQSRIDDNDAMGALEEQLSRDETKAASVQSAQVAWNSGRGMGKLYTRYDKIRDLIYNFKRKYDMWSDRILQKMEKVFAQYKELDTARRRHLAADKNEKLAKNLKEVQLKVELEGKADRSHFAGMLGTLKRWIQVKKAAKANEIQSRLAKLETEMTTRMRQLTDSTSLAKNVTDYYWSNEGKEMKKIRDQIQKEIPGLIKQENTNFAKERDKHDEMWKGYELSDNTEDDDRDDAQASKDEEDKESQAEKPTELLQVEANDNLKSRRCRACSCFRMNSFGLMKLQEELGIDAPPYRVKFQISLTNLPNIPVEKTEIGELQVAESTVPSMPPGDTSDELKKVEDIGKQASEDEEKKKAKADQPDPVAASEFTVGLTELLKTLKKKNGDKTLDPGQICECAGYMDCP